jgi:DNA-binding NtrC family response regulator
MARILIMAGDEDLVFLFGRIFTEHAVRSARTTGEAVAAVYSEAPDLVILDVQGSAADDLASLRAIREARSDQVVIVLTAYGTAQVAVEAIQHGAYDYLFKPFDVGQLRSMIGEALEVAAQHRASTQPANRKEGAPEGRRMPAGMIGTSPVMQDVYRLIGKVAPSDMTVLITGESGTGKELVARMVHAYSRRSGKAFLALNCAAIPEPLLESELFGYERGAFTGALHRKIGKLQVCDGGTLFLDEIGDMSPALQTKMLRVLQDGTFERIGGTETIGVDVRILAATNRDLVELMNQGRFREDLYYRLKVVPIPLPPLRDRGDDIVLLARYFLQQTRHELGRSDLALSDSAVAALKAYRWPGNVRELENVIRGAALTAPGRVILPEHLVIQATGVPGLETTAQPAAADSSDEKPRNGRDIGRLLDPVFQRFHDDYAAGRPGKPFDAIEAIFIRKALTVTEGNQSRAARLLGITRTTLRKRMQKHKIRVSSQVE